jgi:transposase
MWTIENRGRFDRSKLRYPSDLTDVEWALVAPLIPIASPSSAPLCWMAASAHQLISL